MSRASRYLALGLWLALALPASAASVETLDGERHEFTEVHLTTTALVGVTRDGRLRLLPNAHVKAIDGAPFVGPPAAEEPDAEPARAPLAAAEPSAPAGPPSTPVEAAIAQGPTAPLWKLSAGAFKTFAAQEVRTTWFRTGRTMERKPPETLSYEIRERVADGTDMVAELVSHIVEDDRSVELRHRIARQEDGYYLIEQALKDPALTRGSVVAAIKEPPRIWPARMEVGASWVVGPYQRPGIHEVARMTVIAKEAVTVPAGHFPEAYKIKGFGQVWSGEQQLKSGRLITDHGNLETITWFVPGLGPVKEEGKIHLHQTFFSGCDADPEVPFVLEKRFKRELREFGG